MGLALYPFSAAGSANRIETNGWEQQRHPVCLVLFLADGSDPADNRSRR
jgi:hypothetical protein